MEYKAKENKQILPDNSPPTQNTKRKVEDALNSLKGRLPIMKQLLNQSNIKGNLPPNAYKAIQETEKTLTEIIPQMEKINDTLDEIINFILNPLKFAIKKSSNVTIAFGVFGILVGFYSVIKKPNSDSIQPNNIQHIKKIDNNTGFLPPPKKSEVTKKKSNIYEKGKLKGIIGIYFGGSFDIDLKIRKFKNDILVNWKKVRRSKKQILEYNKIVKNMDDLINELNSVELSKSQVNSILALKFNFKLIENIIIKDINYENIIFNINSLIESGLSKKEEVQFRWIKAEIYRINNDLTKAVEIYKIISIGKFDHVVLDLKGNQYFSAKKLSQTRVGKLESYDIPRIDSTIILFNSAPNLGEDRDGIATDGKNILVKNGYNAGNIYVDTSKHTTEVPLLYYKNKLAFKGLEVTVKILYPNIKFSDIEKFKYPVFGNKQVRELFEEKDASFAIRLHQRP